MKKFVASKNLIQTKNNLLAVHAAIEHARHLTREAQTTFKYSCITDDNFDDYVEFYCALSRLDNKLGDVASSQYLEAEEELERLIEND